MEEDFDESAMDACLIAAGQRAEHYEMAAYGTLVAWARAMGHDDAADLLQQNLDEEKAADENADAAGRGRDQPGRRRNRPPRRQRGDGDGRRGCTEKRVEGEDDVATVALTWARAMARTRVLQPPTLSGGRPDCVMAALASR